MSNQATIKLEDIHCEAFESADGSRGVEFEIPGAARLRVHPACAMALGAVLWKHAIASLAGEFGVLGLTMGDLKFFDDLCAASLDNVQRPPGPDRESPDNV